MVTMPGNVVSFVNEVNRSAGSCRQQTLHTCIACALLLALPRQPPVSESHPTCTAAACVSVISFSP